MKSVKMISAVAFVLIFSSLAFGTGQSPDKLIYKGVERDLFTNPLEQYYESNGKTRPHFMVGPMIATSGNWRGYVATWELKEGQLYLSAIKSFICSGNTADTCRAVELAQLFPGSVSDGRVLADWYTGELRVPDGQILQYVHMGYGSKYERELIFKVAKGVVGEPEVIDNRKQPKRSDTEIALEELEKLKNSPLGNKPMFGPAKPKTNEAAVARREPKTGTVITPGQGPFSVGTQRSDLEGILGDGEPGSRYDDVYFVNYPKAGVEVSYEVGRDRVHAIFLYNGEKRRTTFVTPQVKTDKGIDWDSTAKDIINAYGKSPDDFSDESKSWRRIEYPGIDFRFERGKLVRIGILPPKTK